MDPLSKMPKLCPDCGEDHDILFSKEVIELYELIQKEEDPPQKEGLMFDMAEAFAAGSQPSDYELGEDVHEYVADLKAARDAYDRKALQLARVLMRTMPAYVESHDDGDDEIPDDPEVDSSKVN